MRLKPYLGSFRIRLTVLFGSLFLMTEIGISIYVNQVISTRIMQEKGDALHSLASNIAKAVAINLEERQREVILLSQSPLYVSGALDAPAIRSSLQRTKRTYSYYAWIGVANTDAIVLSAADGMLVGQNVSKRPWFREGLKKPFVGDVHEAVLLAKLMAAPPSSSSEPLRFIDFATPVYNEQGQLRGVLATHALWNWVEEIIHNLLPRSAIKDDIQVFIVDSGKNVLSPYDAVGKVQLPDSKMNGASYQQEAWPNDITYLSSAVPVQARTQNDIGWHVIVRQPLQSAQATATQLQTTLLVFALISALLFLFLAYRVARGISKPIEQLAAGAQRIAKGEEEVHLVVDTTTSELQKLGESLRGMTDTLLKRKRELVDANANLEATVNLRTLELQQANAELSNKAMQMERLARHDELTQLYNRRAANEHLLQLYQLWQRHQLNYAVLLIDIDFFKKVNDTYGHDAGDQVLQHVSHLLSSLARTSDFVARFGGEEFLVILSGTNAEGACIVAEKIRSGIENSQSPCVGRVTLSVGVAVSCDHDTTSMDIVHRADKGLYDAKLTGRNRVVLADSKS